MKRALLLLLPLVLAAALIGYFLWSGGVDRYDYAAAFEPAAPGATAASAVSLSAIAGKTRDEVREVLGEPQRCERAQYSERCQYGAARTQIVYIDGKADWLAIAFSDSEAPLAPQTLAAFGLPVREPDELGEQYSLWRNHGGYREVRLVDGGYGDTQLFVKVKTP